VTDNVVTISHLTQVYGRDTVLNLPQLALEKGRIHVLVGPNGAGKTTLLRAIGGLERPTSGQVCLFGRDLYALPGRQRRETMQRMTFCFQKPYLFGASVRRNIEYGLLFRRTAAAEIADRVAAVVQTLNLAALQEHDARTLSAGEAQRVALARALVLEPELVLLDEPVANVDASSREQVEAAIFALRENGSTVVIATHHIEQAYKLSAAVVRLERGEVAPPAIQNVLEGEVVEQDGAPLLRVGDVALHVITEQRGATRAAIDPTSIILSREPFQSSARNVFAGQVVALLTLSHRISLAVDIGIRLDVHITTESFEALDVTLGSRLFMTFKASAITVF
jgi:tungstate transport system ATP-binding protein